MKTSLPLKTSSVLLVANFVIAASIICSGRLGGSSDAVIFGMASFVYGLGVGKFFGRLNAEAEHGVGKHFGWLNAEADHAGLDPSAPQISSPSPVLDKQVP